MRPRRPFRALRFGPALRVVGRGRRRRGAWPFASAFPFRPGHPGTVPICSREPLCVAIAFLERGFGVVPEITEQNKALEIRLRLQGRARAERLIKGPQEDWRFSGAYLDTPGQEGPRRSPAMV